MLDNAGYSIIDLPGIPAELLASYDDLPVDEFMGEGTRYKRFSQYRLSPGGGVGWRFELLPYRDYTAYRKFNKVGGGVRRSYRPIEADFTPLIAAGLAVLDLGDGEDWQINVHQNRSRAEKGRPGPLTPEGVHHDGHEFVMIGVLRRENINGAVTRLWRPDATEPFWAGTLDAGQAIVLDDRALAHDVTDVVSADGQPGFRDIFIVAFSRWSERWYGTEHDAAALEEADPHPIARGAAQV